jgi:hypothetical protein
MYLLLRRRILHPLLSICIRPKPKLSALIYGEPPTPPAYAHSWSFSPWTAHYSCIPNILVTSVQAEAEARSILGRLTRRARICTYVSLVLFTFTILKPLSVLRPYRLPTSRIAPSSVVGPPLDLQARLIPLLPKFSRLLNIVPAMFGFLYDLHPLFQPYHSIPPRSSSGTFSAYTPSSRLSINFINALISLAHNYMYTPPHLTQSIT